MTKNNKILLGVLIALIGIFGITRLIESGNKDTLKTDVVQIDTSVITSIKIYPQVANGEELAFSKNSDSWLVSKGNVNSSVRKSAIENLLTELSNFKIQRLVSKNKDKWEEYQLTDSLATRIKIESANLNEPIEFYVGRFKYEAPQNGYGQYGRNSFNGSTYVRLKDNNVYLVKGFLSMTLNSDFDRWRNNDFISINKSDITSIRFSYPADSSFVLQQSDSLWMIDGTPTDSAKTANYLSSMQNKTISSFANNFIPSGMPIITLEIKGNNMMDVTVKCFADTTSNTYYLESSQNAGVYASSNENGLYKSLMKSKLEFF